MDRKITSFGIIILTVGAIISIPFIPPEIIEQYGPIVFAIPIGIVIIAIIVAFFMVKKKGKLEELQQERQNLIVALKESEKKYLKHKIDQPTFDKISKEKNTKLIKIEAEIDSLKSRDLSKEDLKKADTVSSDKRKVLFDLLQQKQIKIHELKIAENGYYKRKIDESTFQKIASEIKLEIISIESQIEALQQAEEINKLKAQLKESAKEIIKQKKITNARSKEDYMQEMQDDILDQIQE
jgi:hypothetical protein